MCFTETGEHGFNSWCYLHDLAHVAVFFGLFTTLGDRTCYFFLLFTTLGEHGFHFCCYLLRFERDMFTNLAKPLKTVT